MPEQKTATAMRLDMVPDRRRAQINCIVHLVMEAVGKHIPDDGSSRERAYRDLVDALYETGASFFTEQDRLQAGLPPRDERGWTREELALMDCRLKLAMLEPMQQLIMPR